MQLLIKIEDNQSMFSKANYKGQQLSEYGLAIALIAVALIAAAALFGTRASDAIGSMVAGMDKPAPGAVTGPDPGQITLQQVSGNHQDAGGGNSIAVISANGSMLTYANSVSTAIETSGANGTTTEILTLLNNYISQSLASGKLTADEANQLRSLSKKGHEIADIMAIVEDMAINNPSALGRPITHNGTTYSEGKALAAQIGFDPNDGSSKAKLQEFMNLYGQAVKNGTLRDPEAMQVVTTLSNQIFNIANGVEGAAMMIYDGKNYGNFNQMVVLGLTEKDRTMGGNTQAMLNAEMVARLGAAQTTDIKSGQICTEGGTQDCKHTTAPAVSPR